MLAVAAAATTSTKMTAAAMRPALLEWITMQYLGRSELAERLPSAEVIGADAKALLFCEMASLFRDGRVPPRGR
jgi:hypothetical protein